MLADDPIHNAARIRCCKKSTPSPAIRFPASDALESYSVPELATDQDVLAELAELRELVESDLAKRLQFGSGCPAKLAEAIRYAVLAPGKRLRPILTLLAAKSCGGDVQRALPAACAVEFIHAYSLVHDDLPAMDDDDLRRGQPTCHKKFDEATAILVGDALQPLAFETLATEITPPEAAAAACAALARAAGATQLVGGQADDLAGIEDINAAQQDTTLERLTAIHHRKTAAMILVSLELGALTAGATGEQYEALAAYGERFGQVFQITDDLLDAEGDQQRVGKRVGKDADRGKLTYPVLMGGDESRRLAEQLVQQAQASLSCFDSPADPLRYLAQKLLNRDR